MFYLAMCIALIYVTGSNYCSVLCIKCWCSGLTREFRPFMRYFKKYSVAMSEHIQELPAA